MGNQSKRRAPNRATPQPAKAEPGVQEVNPGRLIARLRAQVDAAQFEAAKYGALADELADQVAAKDKALTELEAALEELKAKLDTGEEHAAETPDLKAVK